MMTIEDIAIFLLILTRVLGLFMAAPVFSHKSIPIVGKVTLAAAFAVMALPMVDVDIAMPTEVWSLALWFAKELVVGALMGIGIRMIFFVLDFASHVITVEIGLQPGQAFDPDASSQGNPLGTIIYFLGLAILLSGSEYDILLAFMRSFEVAPLGFFGLNSFAGDYIILATADIFKIGILMGAPIIAVNFLVNLVFAVLGKVVPKLNVFILSFSARIFLGTTVLALTVGLIAHYAVNYISETPEMMLRFILFRPEA
ncbi:flagellar biosynthetic protein FliR [Pelagicoccus sp. NFK12]|uniref:Flagellar biosynthetic protein FliR n=1 Tax=Pelagicoccus enzymogenes TaxID=2773457 RepID=A0A927IGC7_9BACT|nr:flagellar biosynthetic protein FliR [Pelagicoccus enzymogenes]MBD5778664.1 flagellar biosynthetic protein FliR [Pelagicoccus enzymogenes]MDQ8196964.1 flagellar biosynthetic protein FliR [Pelagicoccus enzymogenes]